MQASQSHDGTVLTVDCQSV